MTCKKSDRVETKKVSSWKQTKIRQTIDLSCNMSILSPRATVLCHVTEIETLRNRLVGRRTQDGRMKKNAAQDRKCTFSRDIFLVILPSWVRLPAVLLRKVFNVAKSSSAVPTGEWICDLEAFTWKKLSKIISCLDLEVLNKIILRYVLEIMLQFPAWRPTGKKDKIDYSKSYKEAEGRFQLRS